MRAQYDCDGWLFGKSLKSRLGGIMEAGDTVGTGRHKAVGGMIWATLALRDGHVAGAIVNGDWHPRPIERVKWLEVALDGCPAEPAALEERIEAFQIGRAHT